MGLPSEVLNSQQFRFSVYLVPKIANHEKSADVAMKFIPYDATKPEEMDKLAKIVAMIREKQVPVVNVDMIKAGDVVKEVNRQLPFKFNMHHHTKAWQYYGVRPAGKSSAPEKTKADFCVFDKAHGDYVYTKAWVRFLVQKLSDAAEFQNATAQIPAPKTQPAAKSQALLSVSSSPPGPSEPASNSKA